MRSLRSIAILWAAYPALALTARRGLKAFGAPLAPRMGHGPHHGTLSVADGVARAVARKSLPGCSFLAAGARLIPIPARANAILLRKAAPGLRALGLNPAPLLRTAQASLPVPRAHRAPAGQGQNPRGGNWPASARPKRSRRRPPALPRPTGVLFLRFAQSYPGRQSGALRA